MSFRHWLRSLRTRWTTLVHSLWPPTPQQLCLLEEAALTDRLQRYCRRLLRIRCRLERLRSRQARQEERVNHLQNQRQECASGCAADAARQRACRRLQRTQRRVRRLERLYRRQRDRLDRCQGRLLALRAAPPRSLLHTARACDVAAT